MASFFFNFEYVQIWRYDIGDKIRGSSKTVVVGPNLA